MSKNNVHISKEMKYEEAFSQLQSIVRKMENDEYSIDEIAVQLKTAQQLIKFCKDKLTKTEEEILKVQGSELKVQS
jgi:exodeoxyribonuclease VII small subunit